MSLRTSLSAVAVRAMIGIVRKSCFSRASRKYSGRKSCPQLEMQCASSIAKSETLIALQKIEKLVAALQQPLRSDIKQL